MLSTAEPRRTRRWLFNQVVFRPSSHSRTAREVMGRAKVKRRWKCTTKPRGNCPNQCKRVFTGFGATKQDAKSSSEKSCQTAGCHTPGGQPHNCQCGHTS